MIQNKIALTTLTGTISKLILAASQFLAIFIINRSLGITDYAIFGLLTGMVAWYLLAEFGVGPALQNSVTTMIERKIDYTAHIASIFLLMLLMGFILVLIIFLSKNYLASLLLTNFDISQNTKNNLIISASSIYIFITIFSIQYKILFAEGRGYVANYLIILSSILSIVSLSIVSFIPFFEKNILNSIIGFLLPSLIIPMIFFIKRIFQNFNNFKFTFDISSNDTFNFQNIASFWIINILAAFVVQIDVFIIANFFEPNEIALYLLIGKVFSLIYFSYNAYLQAIWPKFLEEFLKKNWSAINGLIIKSMKISFLVCFISVSVIFIFIESIILVLSNNELNEISYILFLGFVLVIFVRVWTDIFATFLQSISKTHIFLSSIFLQAIINAYLMITMGKIFGINGIIYALLFSYLLTVAWTLPTYFHYLKKYT